MALHLSTDVNADDYIVDENGVYVARVNHKLANWRELSLLFAAAPDLLAACKGLLDFIQTFNIGGEWCQDNYPAIKAAHAVIAQAEVQDA
jgi:hypothetical protein